MGNAKHIVFSLKCSQIQIRTNCISETIDGHWLRMHQTPWFCTFSNSLCKRAGQLKSDLLELETSSNVNHWHEMQAEYANINQMASNRANHTFYLRHSAPEYVPKMNCTNARYANMSNMTIFWLYPTESWLDWAWLQLGVCIPNQKTPRQSMDLFGKFAAAQHAGVNINLQVLDS